mgnify:CR=1 FL=1
MKPNLWNRGRVIEKNRTLTRVVLKLELVITLVYANIYRTLTRVVLKLLFLLFPDALPPIEP